MVGILRAEQFKDRILLSKNSHPDIRGWAEQELVNNKPGWEAQGSVSSSLLSGTYQDYLGNDYLIPQTMAGVQIDIDSDDFQA